MGISGLERALRQMFPASFVQADPRAFDHVGVDINSILHMAINSKRTRNEANMQVAIIQRLRMLLTTAHPTRSCLLAVDGPGPLAKLHEQRTRRVKQENSTATKQRCGSGGGGGGGKGGKGGKGGRGGSPAVKIDTLQVTPGTDFMLRHDDLLHVFAHHVVLEGLGQGGGQGGQGGRGGHQRGQGHGGYFNRRGSGGESGSDSRGPRCVIVSGALTPDEGELKLLKHMYELNNGSSSSSSSGSESRGSGRVGGGGGDSDEATAASGGRGGRGGGESHCLVGDDADLLVMAMLCGVTDVSVLRSGQGLVGKVRKTRVVTHSGPPLVLGPRTMQG
jgi:5'-3' exonuclease